MGSLYCDIDFILFEGFGFSFLEKLPYQGDTSVTLFWNRFYWRLKELKGVEIMNAQLNTKTWSQYKNKVYYCLRSGLLLVVSCSHRNCSS